MKLQVAIDVHSIEEAIKLMNKIGAYVDIVEIGSFLGLIEGFRGVSVIKSVWPDKEVLSDAKIVDGGYGISAYAYDMGADIVTTIAITDDYTLRGLVQAAHERGKKAMVDTINFPHDRLMERVQELDKMGFDYILLHTPHESEATNSANINDVRECKKIVKNAQIGISGGITLDYMPDVVSADPDWIVVGGALYNAENPEATAKAFKEIMNGGKKA